MFDALVQELASRFDLGGKAGALVRAVLTYLFQEESGGLNGFLDRFRRAGLGDLVGSWMGGSAPREITPWQLEGAVGRNILEQLADKAGVPVSKATPALAMLLPKLIGMLTADGKVPTAIPAGVSSWLGGAARAVGTAQAEPAGERVGTYRAEPVREPVVAAKSPWPWLLPLLALGALALLWALWPTAREVPPPAATRVTPAPAPTAPTAPATTELWPLKIYFATGSKTLGAEDAGRIQRAVDYLQANAAAAVDITGFADQTGSAAANEELAKERAKAVRDALVAAGIAESRTNLAPPVSVTPATADDAEARRVEIRPKG
jgi:uncharacterized protein YidB (DUF937 family)